MKAMKQREVKAKSFQKYFKQIPKEQRKDGFEKLSNYKCYANLAGGK